MIEDLESVQPLRRRRSRDEINARWLLWNCGLGVVLVMGGLWSVLFGGLCVLSVIAAVPGLVMIAAGGVAFACGCRLVIGGLLEEPKEP